MSTTWNPADKGANVALSNGNLTLDAQTTDSVRATSSKSTGDQSYSVTVDTVNAPQTPLIGLGTSGADIGQYPGFDAFGWSYYTDGTKYTGNVGTAYGATYTAGDVIKVRWNATAGEIEFFKNGASQGVAFTAISATLFPMVGCGSTGGNHTQCTADFSLWDASTANFFALF